MATMEELVAALKAADAAGRKEDARKLADAVVRLREMQNQQGASQPSATTYGEIPESIDPNTLSQNKDWLAASKILWEQNHGRKWGEPDLNGTGDGADPFAGYTDEQLAEYGLNTMGWFNYNMVAMGADAAKVQTASPEYQRAFLHLMESYDALEMSLGGTWRFAKGVALDPTTYVGLGTFGIGTAAAQGGKAVTKQGLKELLKQGIKRSVPLAIEGAAYGAATSVATQSVEVAGGAKEAISGTEVLGDAALGAAAIGTIGVGAHVGGNMLKKGYEAATGAVPTTAPTTPSTQGAVPSAPNAAPTVAPVSNTVTTNAGPVAPSAGPVAPNAATSATPVAPSPVSLPGNLAGAKPRYNYGQKGFGLQFESDVEKALFITSQAKKSKSDGAYRSWLKSIGYDDAEIDSLGKQVRDAIKAKAKTSNDAELTIGRIAPDKQAIPSAPVNPQPKPNTARPTMENVDAPNTTKVEDVIAAVKQAAPDMTVGNVPRTKAGMFKMAEDAYNALRNLGIKDAEDALNLFTRNALTQDQQTTIKIAVQQAADNMTVARSEFLKVKNSVSSTADEVRQATEALERIGPMQKTLADLDKAISSPSGRDLGSRVGGILTNDRRGMSVESILAERDIDAALATVDDLTAAENELIKRVDDFIERVRTDREIVDIEKQVQEAFQANNLTEAAKLLAERDAKLVAKAKKEAKKQGVVGKTYDMLSEGIIKKLNEYVISTVFTPATLVVNALPAIVKTIALPTRTMLVKGVGKAARAEAYHTYATMLSHQGAAFKAARAAFKYERGLLTGDFDKVLEQGPAIKGFKGRVLRTFPRLLNATDEFFARIHYRGYVAGEAAFQATQKGVEKGLKGDALKAFVKTEVDKAVRGAYEMAPDTVEVLDMLRIKGAERGLKGDALGIWMQTELDKNADLFRRATNESGIDYADDVLFKRAFSGDNRASKLARGYENFVNRNPIMRLAGQLFFRTPVRVFQEGIRLTPGYQFLDPTFLPDLMGRNGVGKQMRAKGELLMSYGIMASVIAMYSTGMITGAGPSDYKQRRMLEDTKDWEPYTIRFSDGRTWSYRNMDPFATPIKIMVNLMDRINEVEYRRAQGEKTDGTAAQLQQYSSVVLGSLVQAIRDASLTTGFDQIMDGWDAITQDEDTRVMEELQKLIGKKVQMFIPGIYAKPQQINDPNMRDPLTLEQYVMAKIDATAGKVPMMYDALGRPRTINNAYSNWLFPFTTSKEDREKGISEKEQLVLNGLADLAIANDTNFAFPFKMPGFDFDMRRRMTSDGQETLYDRVVRRYRELNPTDTLYPLFAEEIGGEGTKNSDGSRLTAARQVINAYRKAAFAQVLSEELNLQEELIRNRLNDAEAQVGARDASSIPFRR